MHLFHLGTFAALLALSCSGDAPGRTAAGREPVVGLPCEGCEAVFVGLPEQLAWHSRIATPEEPGEALRLEGVVRDGRGRPVEGVIVYAYHTDASGIYPREDRLRGTEADRHGRLRGWVRTDAEGSYRFDTIRPACYPGTNPPPQHVHMHLIEPGRCTYYLGDVYFDDDPMLSEAIRRRCEGDRGGSGLVMPIRDGDGVWIAQRDVELGKAVPGYPAR